MHENFKDFISGELKSIKEAGLYKAERIILTPQGASIGAAGTKGNLINLCSNNYLGLSDSEELIAAAVEAMCSHGYGMSSVRFICGTQDIHKSLEDSVSSYFGTEDSILYSSCFDANGGLFEPLFSDQDAIISDSLNHASIIDGVRLSKAKRFRYANADMDDLERCLKESSQARFRVIATDGVFSMDGNVAPLGNICSLAEKYDALVMVDESHSAGVVGATGRGVTELFNCRGRIDIITGTLGKAFGGAMGGFTTGKREIIDLLRQRSRPYLFSNSLAPSIVGASIEVFNLLSKSDDLHTKLMG
ncbi:MAG: glycine C-acetyltransferase, partial [Tannerellaceae bacterium]|nr:glycine C-acetyltransferase [Tannerellaceae bacterium]